MINNSNYENQNNNKLINENEIIQEFYGEKEELVHNLTNFITSIRIRKNYKIICNDFVLNIEPTNSTLNKNSTHVNFTQCENI